MNMNIQYVYLYIQWGMDATCSLWQLAYSLVYLRHDGQWFLTGGYSLRVPTPAPLANKDVGILTQTPRFQTKTPPTSTKKNLSPQQKPRSTSSPLKTKHRLQQKSGLKSRNSERALDLHGVSYGKLVDSEKDASCFIYIYILCNFFLHVYIYQYTGIEGCSAGCGGSQYLPRGAGKVALVVLLLCQCRWSLDTYFQVSTGFPIRRFQEFRPVSGMVNLYRSWSEESSEETSAWGR